MADYVGYQTLILSDEDFNEVYTNGDLYWAYFLENEYLIAKNENGEIITTVPVTDENGEVVTEQTSAVEPSTNENGETVEETTEETSEE